MDVTKFQLSDCFSQIPLEFSRLDLVLQVASQVVQNLEARKTNHSDINHQWNWSCYHFPMEQGGWWRVWRWHRRGRGWCCCCCGGKEGGRGGADEGSREGGSACHLIILICTTSTLHRMVRRTTGKALILIEFDSLFTFLLWFPKSV